MPKVDYNKLFDPQLKDPQYASIYLKACMEDSLEVFLMAVNDVARVNNITSDEVLHLIAAKVQIPAAA